MPEIKTDRDLKHSIEITISKASLFLFVVSPYIDIDDDLKKAFSILKPDVVKTIVYREFDKSHSKSGISDDSRAFFKTLPNIEFVAVKNLHAKFFINEDYTVISSMNMTSSSNHNHEIGVEIDNETHYEMFKDCFEYLIYDILDSNDSNMNKERMRNIIPKLPFRLDINGKLPKINGKDVSREDFEKLEVNCNVKHGFCIRCETHNIDFHPLYPMCKSCYSIWSKFKNKDHEEKVCHRCGIELNATINDPLCDNCDEVYKFEIEREWNKVKKKEKVK